MSSPVSLLTQFAALDDPRQAGKVIFPIEEILLVVLCGTLAGAEDFVEMRRWAVVHKAFLRQFLPFVRGNPSHDTLNDVVNALDGDLFSQCFTQWVDDLRRHGPDIADPEVVAIDGKTSRRTHDRGRDRCPLRRVSAWASAQRLVLGQQACEAKSNEITAIPQLLDRLALTGALVTIDAMGCQTKIAQKILDRGGDYLLAVKDNQPSLHDEVARYFSQADPAKLGQLETTDGEHGRIKVRRHAVSTDADWLTTDRRFPGEPRFPGLAASDKNTASWSAENPPLGTLPTLNASSVRKHDRLQAAPLALEANYNRRAHELPIGRSEVARLIAGVRAPTDWLQFLDHFGVSTDAASVELWRAQGVAFFGGTPSVLRLGLDYGLLRTAVADRLKAFIGDTPLAGVLPCSAESAVGRRASRWPVAVARPLT